MTLNCIIIDDEPMARKLLQEYLEETGFLKLAGIAENPLKAIQLLGNTAVDLIFLDINMPKMNGISFLKTADDLPMVIMTTAYGEYALEGFDLSVVDYLVKPFSLERFVRAANKALALKSLKEKAALLPAEGEDHFFIKCDGKIERVFYDDLLYVEGMTNYITLHTRDRNLIVYLTIKGMLEKLPNTRFLQVHKSYIVNLKHVSSIEGNLLRVSGNEIAIGANYSAEVMDRLLKGKFIKR